MSRFRPERLKNRLSCCWLPVIAILSGLGLYQGYEIVKDIDLGKFEPDNSLNFLPGVDAGDTFHADQESDEDVFSSIRRESNKHTSVEQIQETLLDNLATYQEDTEYRSQVRLIGELMEVFNLSESQLETLIHNSGWLQEGATRDSWNAARNLNETDPRQKLLTFNAEFDPTDVFFLQENGNFTSAFIAPNVESALQGVFATIFARTNNTYTATAETNRTAEEHGLDATGGFQRVVIFGQEYYVYLTSRGEVVLQRYETDVPSNHPDDQANDWRCINYFHFPEQAFPWADHKGNAGSMQLVIVQQDAQTGRFEVMIYNVGDEATIPTDMNHEEFFNDDKRTEGYGFPTKDDCGPGVPQQPVVVPQFQTPPGSPPETPPETPPEEHKNGIGETNPNGTTSEDMPIEAPANDTEGGTTSEEANSGPDY